MVSIILIMVMLCIARLASVYDRKLLLSGYIGVSPRLSAALVSSVLFPFSKSKNPPENRKRLTVLGLCLYTLTALCIALCVYNGLTLKPVKALEQFSMAPKGRGVEIETSTEYLNGMIAMGFFCFEAAAYLINSIGFFVSRAGTAGKKLAAGGVTLALAILAIVLFIFFMGRGVPDFWRQIQQAME